MAMEENQKNDDIQKRMNMPRQRSAKLEGFDEASRTVTLSFASETPCIDCWGDKEILRCTDEAMDKQRFDDGVMPILYNHQRDAVIGKPTKIWTENGRARAAIEFATTEKAEEIMGLVRDGFLNGVSVGYCVKQWQVLEKGETTVDGIEGPAWIATRWEVFEISIVTVPADGTVGVGRSLAHDADNVVEQHKAPKKEREVENMEEKEKTAPTEAEIRSAAIKAERERCAAIDGLCRKFDVDAEQRQKWIDGGQDVETVNREMLGILEARNKAVPSNRTEVGEDRANEMRAVYTDAILMRHGVNVAKPHEGADRLRHMSMRNMAIDMLTRAGANDAYTMDDTELFKRAMTTGGLPIVLQDVVKYAIKDGYDAANTTYQAWAHIGTLNDFRPANIVEIGAEAEPKLIPENGEFTDMNLTESKESVRLDTYGRSYSYTRQAFINDDMRELTEIPRIVSSRMAAYINAQAYKALAGATFNAGNTGTAGAISVASLAEAMQKMRMAKDKKGNFLRIMPKYLLVPVAQAVTAAQLLHSAADPSASHSGVNNPFANAFEIISDPELDALSAAAWYLAAAPKYGYGVQVNFLNGNQTPIVESQVSFDTLGWKYRIYHDFGVKALSTLGVVKNAGK